MSGTCLLRAGVITAERGVNRRVTVPPSDMPVPHLFRRDRPRGPGTVFERSTMRIRNSAAVLAAGALVAALAACGSSDSGSTADSGSSSSKPIVAVADPSLLPYNFLAADGKTWQGINVDLAAELSKKLGRTVTFTNAGFDTIIPGLLSGRYDVALTGMFDTKEREKSVDFVDYLKAANNFLALTSFPDVATMDDLCGDKVGIPSGALEGELLATASKKCTAAGKKAIDVSEYKTLDAVILALKAGRIQVTPNDSAANAYILSQNKTAMKTSGSYSDDGYFAAGFKKGSTLTAEFQKAFNDMIADGTYATVLTKWGIATRGMTTATVNQATF